MLDTTAEFDRVISLCRELFEKKMKDYGAAWRVLRGSSITDLIYIKVRRIRILQDSPEAVMVEESEKDGFMAIVNYCVIALIQLEKEGENEGSEGLDAVLSLYDQQVGQARDLMLRKNNDYGESWREMRVSSITDLIYQKVLRIKQIEDNHGRTIVSEGVFSNYLDMLNYAVFCLIRLDGD